MRTRISVDEYEQMTFDADLRLELLRGEIVPMSPIGDRHAWTVTRLTYLLMSAVGAQGIVYAQNPLVLDESEPQPDLSVLRFHEGRFPSLKPRADDVLLVVEVSDSTLDKDREIKGPLYAEAGIPEYWIVNLIDECVEVYRDPLAEAYASCRVYRSEETIEVPGASGVKLKVAEIL